MELDLIIRQFKNNKFDNFDYFYDQTSKNIFFSAYTILKDYDKANDIVQDTYLAFLNTITTYKIGGNVNAYLARIARNLSINQYNKDKRIQINNEFVESFGSFNADTTKEVEDILNLLDDELERSVIVYHIICDYKFREIATITNKPLGTILWKYNKAMKKLRERIVEVL